MTINIPLIDGYRILSDKYQYILAKQDGDRIFHISFHVDIESLIQTFISMKIRGFNSKSIHELLLAIKSLEARLNKALRPLNLQVVQKKEVLE